MYAGPGDDSAGHDPRNDRYDLGGGDDVFGVRRGGDDVVLGGPGDDTLSAFGAELPIDLTTGVMEIGRGQDEIAGIERVFGTAQDDTLIGDASNNLLRGGDGDDQIEGRDGDDSLNGGAGVDSLDGGNGIDRCLNGETVLNCET